MKNEFLIIHKDVLPDYFLKVIKAADLIKTNKKNVSEVCKALDISRSTFYKYKDKVFELSSDYGRKAIISFKVIDEMGVLSTILNKISDFKGNILTINQDMPIHKLAYITITLDIKNLQVSIYELVSALKKIDYVNDVELIALD